MPVVTGLVISAVGAPAYFILGGSDDARVGQPRHPQSDLRAQPSRQIVIEPKVVTLLFDHQVDDQAAFQNKLKQFGYDSELIGPMTTFCATGLSLNSSVNADC